MRLGNKEQDLIIKLLQYGVTESDGEAIWKLPMMETASTKYKIVLFKRIMRLQQKGILTIKNDGPRGGKVIYFTGIGFELAQKLTKNNK